MIFSEFLIKKKIDPSKFQAAEPERYAEWEALFEQVNEESFVMQKKFLINDVRRRFQYQVLEN